MEGGQMVDTPSRDGAATASRWLRRGFWGWQAVFALPLGVMLIGFWLESLDLLAPGMEILLLPYYLIVPLAPVWLAGTLACLLGLLAFRVAARPRRRA